MGKRTISNITAEQDRSYVFLNVSGTRYCVKRKLLRKFPHTRLSQMFIDSQSTENLEYYYDRNPFLFSHVLDFYRTGKVHFPHFYCHEVIEQELAYWGLEDSYISDCCAAVLREHQNRIKEIHDLQHIFGDDQRKASNLDKKETIRFKMARFFQNTDEKGKPAKWAWMDKAYYSAYVVVVLFYLGSYILQAEQSMRVEGVGCPNIVNTTRDNPKYHKYFTTYPPFALQIMDLFCNIIFNVDLILRFVVSPSTRQFVNQTGNVVDIFCNAAGVVATIIALRRNHYQCTMSVLLLYLMIEVFRVLRLIRLLLFAHRYNGITVLMLSLRHSLKELILLMTVLCAGIIVFGFAIYISEIDNAESDLDSFLVGFWWAIVTMTTLGYGDFVPSTPFGYVTGSLCAVSGVIFVALQVPVIANKFNALYTYACEQQVLTKYNSEQAVALEDVDFHKQLNGIPQYTLSQTDTKRKKEK